MSVNHTPSGLAQRQAQSSITVHSVRIAAISLLLISGTYIVYQTGGTGYAYPYLLLLPVILTSAWYRLWGGIVCAVIAGLMLGPLMPLSTVESVPQTTYNWVARLTMFVIIAWFTGTVFQRLRQAITIDNRTNLPNYQALHEDVRRALLHRRLTHSMRKHPVVMVVVLRLVDLWEVTEAFGINAADRVVELLANELKRQIHHIRDVYMFSSTELALLIVTDEEHVQNAVSATVIEQVQGAGEHNITVDGTDVRIQLAAGSYVATRTDIDPEVVIRRARSGLITALENEDFHHSFVFADDHRLSNRIQLISGVRAALANKEFELFYQPKLDLSTMNLAGCEGLIRWSDGKGGFVPPGAFMPKVESTTLITPVTRQVVELACDLIKRHPQSIPVSVNWAARNLLDDQLIDWLGETVDTFGIEPATLEIEITEGALIHNPDHARENVKKLRSMGFPVSLDDFGTGYSSFQYLTQLPISGLKIDRAFVINLETDATARKVMKGMIDLAHTLNLKVTVEGLETREQCSIVSALGADFGQGYYLAKPMAEQSFTDYLLEPGLPASQQWVSS